MQTIVCLALCGEQLAGLTDDLFKHRHSESAPQIVAIGVAHPLLFRAAKNDDGMRQRWNAFARESVQLLESAGDGRRGERRRLYAPSVREDA